MRYVSHAKAITVHGSTWWVNARKSGLFTHMAKRIISQVDAMLDHHNKIHLIRFDLHQPEYIPNNKHISDFNRRLHGKLTTKYQLTRIGFIWVRELEKAKKQHYHYVLILDGNKVQHPHHVLKLASEVWEHMDGFCYKPKNCYYNIERGNHNQLQRAILRISYLAKGRGKGYRPRQTKDFSTSRIKQKGKSK
ncbi:MAG: inovirus-type Gp2 protein [Cellvibrio sp.]|nr:inovirus-type Gp2 protein [Cellvibrio sp.]